MCTPAGRRSRHLPPHLSHFSKRVSALQTHLSSRTLLKCSAFRHITWCAGERPWPAMCGLSSIATTPRSATATALPLASSQRLASPLRAFANTPISASPPSPVRTECATAVPQNDKPAGQGRFIPWDFGCACSAYRRCGQAGSAVAVVLMQEFEPLRIRSSHIVDCVNLRHKGKDCKATTRCRCRTPSETTT